jgi:DNA-binding transcriptional MerR regulator
MTRFTFYANPTVTLVCLPVKGPVLFPLEAAARLTGLHPEMLRYYCRAGLIEALRGVEETELFFDEKALQEIRRIEHYRRHLGVGRRALPLICELRRAGERQQIELHFLREP